MQLMTAASLSRFTNLLIFVGLLLLALALALYQVNRLLQELIPTQQQLSASLSQLQWISNPSRSDFAAAAYGRRDLEPWRNGTQQRDIDIVKQQVEGLLKEAITYREEMEEVKGKVLELQRFIKGQPSGLSLHQTTNFVEFFPLKDKIMQARGDSHTHHYFMSMLKGRGMVEGPPEFFVFPQGPNETHLLCLRGNNTSDGAQNSYALVSKEHIPTEAKMVTGITLISDTFWDFTNPWHSMFNLLQFVYWRIDNGCSHAHNLLLFHQGEFRISMGNWIKSLLQACGVPTSTLNMDAIVGGGSHISPPTICFEHCVVSRSGVGGMKRPLLSKLFTEARCQARKACHIHHVESIAAKDERKMRNVNVTLIVRQGSRGFVDEATWQRVVKEQCEAALNCRWFVMHVGNLTFCQQVEAMSRTDILVSAHGAQLSNIVFMTPGGSVMEMFPSGWLDMAGHGQFIYKNLATWLGLQHEGYWRDPSTPPCPNSSDVSACFSHYKDQPLGINITHISNWLGKVIHKFQDASVHPLSSPSKHDKMNSPYLNACECNKN